MQQFLVTIESLSGLFCRYHKNRNLLLTQNENYKKNKLQGFQYQALNIFSTDFRY